MNVLVTGANGTVGTALRDHLETDRDDFTWLDIEPHSDPDCETTIGDVTDYATVRAAMVGQDAVVHLGMPDFVGGPDDRSLAWSAGFGQSCQAIANVFEAAANEGVDTVVYASSNHAVGMYEAQNAPEIYGEDSDLEIDHTVRPRPDSRYGVVKVFGEAMAQLAADAHGCNCYALRICSVRGPEYDHPYGDAERGVETGAFERESEGYERQVARQACMWQSRRDVAQQVRRCLERGHERANAADEADRQPPGEFEVFYGRSASDRSWFDLEHARAVIGYEPADDATRWDGPPGE
ncbi:NAD-dependent epimerase/dehydratase family protein [Natrialbaceae archaeon A-CW2]